MHCTLLWNPELFILRIGTMYNWRWLNLYRIRNLKGFSVDIFIWPCGPLLTSVSSRSDMIGPDIPVAYFGVSECQVNDCTPAFTEHLNKAKIKRERCIDYILLTGTAYAMNYRHFPPPPRTKRSTLPITSYLYGKYQ